MNDSKADAKPKVFIAPQISPLNDVSRLFFQAAKIAVPVVVVGLLGVGTFSLLKPDPVKRARIDKIKQSLVDKGVDLKDAEKRAVAQIDAEDAAVERKRLFVESETKKLIESGGDPKVSKILAEARYKLQETMREQEESQRASDAALREHIKVIDEVRDDVRQSERERRRRESENDLQKLR